MGKPTIGMNEVDLVLKVNEHHVDLIEAKAKPVHLFFLVWLPIPMWRPCRWSSRWSWWTKSWGWLRRKCAQFAQFALFGLITDSGPDVNLISNTAIPLLALSKCIWVLNSLTRFFRIHQFMLWFKLSVILLSRSVLYWFEDKVTWGAKRWHLKKQLWVDRGPVTPRKRFLAQFVKKKNSLSNDR